MPEGDSPHRRSIRLTGYDYAWPGAYFLTVVTASRHCLFGEVATGEMHLNAFGQIAAQQWQRLPTRFACLELGAFVVMPNHVHGILILHDPCTGTAGRSDDNGVGISRRAPTAGHHDDGRGTAGQSDDNGIEISRRAPTQAFGKPVPHSIPTIVRSYKSAVAYRIHLVHGAAGTVVWQRNYYERIIRNQKEWERIHLYIDCNPVHWSQDEENPSNHP